MLEGFLFSPMPVFSSTYQMPALFKHGDISTVYSALCRKVSGVVYERETFELSDGDFLHLDWSKRQSKKLCVIMHGLEGNTQRSYMKGMVKKFNEKGWDSLAINFRGCSSTMNRLYRSYHSGATEDLKEVTDHICSLHRYTSIALVGFSLGGNVLLKYLGEESKTINPKIKAGIAISTPCDLQGARNKIMKPRNRLYELRFLKRLKQKLIEKHTRFPNRLQLSDIIKVKTLKEFDDLYTAPTHGFKNAMNYYTLCSSKPLLPQIKIPCLIINAQNDPLLSSSCYPIQEATQNDFLYLDMPKYGGHVGFCQSGNYYWNEQRAWGFIQGLVLGK